MSSVVGVVRGVDLVHLLLLLRKLCAAAHGLGRLLRDQVQQQELRPHHDRLRGRRAHHCHSHSGQINIIILYRTVPGFFLSLPAGSV